MKTKKYRTTDLPGLQIKVVNTNTNSGFVATIKSVRATEDLHFVYLNTTDDYHVMLTFDQYFDILFDGTTTNGIFSYTITSKKD